MIPMKCITADNLLKLGQGGSKTWQCLAKLGQYYCNFGLNGAIFRRKSRMGKELGLSRWPVITNRHCDNDLRFISAGTPEGRFRIPLSSKDLCRRDRFHRDNRSQTKYHESAARNCGGIGKPPRI